MEVVNVGSVGTSAGFRHLSNYMDFYTPPSTLVQNDL
jgi:hypothetical protein